MYLAPVVSSVRVPLPPVPSPPGQEAGRRLLEVRSGPVLVCHPLKSPAAVELVEVEPRMGPALIVPTVQGQDPPFVMVTLSAARCLMTGLACWQEVSGTFHVLLDQRIGL